MLFAYNIKRLEETPLEKTSEPKHQTDWHPIEIHNWHNFDNMPHMKRPSNSSLSTMKKYNLVNQPRLKFSC